MTPPTGSSAPYSDAQVSKATRASPLRRFLVLIDGLAAGLSGAGPLLGRTLLNDGADGADR
jgi:hypothetical protein